MASITEVGQIVYKVQLDTKDFENQISKTEKNVSDFANTGQKAAGALGKVLGGVVTTGATVAAGAIAGLATKGLNATSTMQSLQVQMNGLTKSTKLGAQAMATAKKFWENNPFQRIDVATTTKQLLAYGRTVKDIGGDLQTLGNLSITSGASLQDLSAIYGKAAAQGKVDSMILRQFAAQGIGVIGELAKITGKSEAEISANAGRMGISFDQLRQALSNVVDPSVVEQLSNTIPRQLDKLGGKLTTLGTAFVGGEMTAEGFKTAQDGLAMAVVNLIKSINDLLGSKAVIEAVTAAGKVFVPVIDSITNIIKKAEPVVVGFFSAISNLGDMAGPALATLALGVGSFASQIPIVSTYLGPLAKMFQSFTSSISEGVGKIAAKHPALIFLAVGAALITLAGTMGISGDQIAGFVNGIVNSIVGMVTKIISVLPTLVQGFIDGFVAIMDALPVIIDNIVNQLPNLIDAIVGVIPQLVQGLLTGLPRLVTAAVKMVDSLVEGIVQNLPMLVDAAIQIIIELVNALLDQLPLIIQSAVQIITTLATALITALPLILSAVIRLMVGLVQAIIQNLPLIIQTTIRLVLTIARALIDNIDLLMEGVFQLVMGIAQGIIDNLDQIIDAALDLIDALVDGLIENMPLLIEGALEIVLALAKGLIMNAPKILEAGVKLIFALIRGIGSMIGKVGDKVAEVARKIPEKIQEKLQAVKDAAKNLMKGLWEGILKAKDTVVNKVKEVCNGALDAIKNFFGIHSPSKVMAQMGNYMMEGLENGIASAGKGAVEEAQKVSSAVADAFGIETAGINPVVGTSSAFDNAFGSGSSSRSGFGSVVVNQNVVANTPVDMQIINQRLGNAVRRATA